MKTNDDYNSQKNQLKKLLDLWDEKSKEIIESSSIDFKKMENTLQVYKTEMQEAIERFKNYSKKKEEIHAAKLIKNSLQIIRDLNLDNGGGDDESTK